LTPETPGGPDVFIAAENIGTAMHGDRVVARISRDTPDDRIKGRREGRVIRILERAHDTIVGTLQRSRNFYYVVPDDPRFVHDSSKDAKTCAKTLSSRSILMMHAISMTRFKLKRPTAVGASACTLPTSPPM